MKLCYFSVMFSNDYPNKVPINIMAKFLLQVKYEQRRLTMSQARRLSLSYQRIPSWGAVTN